MTAEKLTPAQSSYAEMITGLHQNWTPHVGQLRVGSALFRDDIRSIFVQCGRKWGKTELILYILWRWAFMNPGKGCYYVAPFFKQAKEIIWADPRIQDFGPRRWVRSINNTELRITLTNGSFIKLEGSDNFEAHRGTRPGIVCYEEYKDHRPEFRRVMRPNISVFNAPEIFIGTPPDRDCDFTETAQEHQADPKKFFYHAPTRENHHISREWLEEERLRCIARGEEDYWQREFEALFVKGGQSKIFPMLTKDHVKPHQELMDEIKRDMKKLEYILWADPAAATCFAVLFVAINPYTKKIYVLDEIYEMLQGEMTVKRIGKRIIQKKNELWERAEWRQGYDEAATWFANEMLDHFEESFEPSHKALHDKDYGLSLIKDIILQGKFVMSDRCQKFYWEMDNYFKDKNGRIPKVNDHQIDNFRYILGAYAYDLNNKFETKDEDDEDFRGEPLRIQEDMEW